LVEENKGKYLQTEVKAHMAVYRAREVCDQQRLVAVKKLNIPGVTESGVPAFMIREVALLRSREIGYFNHPNILKSLDLTLVFEYRDQDLSTFLTMVPSTGLSLDKIKLLHGLDFRHTIMLVHRDLKPENVLVSSRGEVKIADIGLARTSSFECTICSIVTVPFIFLSMCCSSVDMWSAGCIFTKLFLLRPLFRGYAEAQQLQKIFYEEDWPRESPITYTCSWCPRDPCTQLLSNLGQEENNLLLQCLAFSPANRISASRALSHPFLALSNKVATLPLFW
uniref:Cyclin-dependent kinase 21 n=1 Tax=Salmo trutta TaxID=8032 RepID=A0A673W952_SALTR